MGKPAKKGAAVCSPSDTLYVAGISSVTVDSDLMVLFRKHGALDCVAMHGDGSRSYAFVFFRTVDEARSAMEKLQGEKVLGFSIRIYFARPAKTCRHIWVGGISSSVTKEQLEIEFQKFGKTAHFEYFRDRKTALISYYNYEDASSAQKNLNGINLADEVIHIDFQRPLPVKRDWPDHGFRDECLSSRRVMGPPQSQLLPCEMRSSYNVHHGFKNPMCSTSNGDGIPNKVLLVSYPPSVHMNEQLLHNAMILFGEIENIRCFPSRNYSFVEFRSVDEARLAKEGLEGRLHNDPRILISYLSSDLPLFNDSAPRLLGLRRERPGMFVSDLPFGPPEILGHGSALMQCAALPLPRPALLMRPFGPHGFDPPNVVREFHDSEDMRPPFRPISDGWHEFDVREQKRSRVDGAPIDVTSFNGWRRGPEGARDPVVFSQSDGIRPGKIHSPVLGESETCIPVHDYIWRGIIAKGGAHVCHARCVPMSRGVDFSLPQIVNCSARTGLDILAKHYGESGGFDIVYFLPDNGEDFATYTEFLHYLGGKNRAGVAKLDDGNNLFLVPPSDFLSKVLNISGPERLYGVVLRMQLQRTNVANDESQVAKCVSPLDIVHPQQAPILDKDSSIMIPNNGQFCRTNYGSSSFDASTLCSGSGNQVAAHASEFIGTQSSTPAKRKIEVSLTPELLATLASLIPNSAPTSAVFNPQTASIVSTTPPSIFASAGNERTMPNQERGTEQQAIFSLSSSQQTCHPSQQLGQLNNQAHSHFSNYGDFASGSNYSAQHNLDGMQVRGSSLNMLHAAAVSNQLFNNHTVPFQSEFLPQDNAHHLVASSFSSYDNPVVSQVADTIHPHEQNTIISSSSHPLIGNMSSELPNQVQNLQSVLPGSAQGHSETDTERNQRYQSTLQFAANILFQCQQQQRACAEGSGSQH